MVHRDWTNTLALVFDMTTGAPTDICVKRGRLPLQKGLIVRVAANALGCFHAVNRSVASGAFLFQERVGGGQLAWADIALQTPDIRCHVGAKRAQCGHGRSETDHDHNHDPDAHGWSHLIP
jgi:hypothetical protein